VITDTYTFEVDLQGGAGWQDISDYVDAKSFVRERSIYNNLKPTINTMRLSINRNATLFNSFFTCQNEILFKATKNTAAYFTGYVKPTFKYSVKSTLQKMNLEIIDNGYRLQRRIMSDITYIGYNVIDTSTTTESIIHKLLTAAGYSAGEINVTSIAKTIDYFTIEKGKQTYQEAITNLLFEFGYNYYHDESGDFCIYKWLQDTISTTDKFQNTGAGKNITGELSASVKPVEIKGVDVAYWPHYQITENIPVFNEQEGSESSYATRKGKNCFVELSDDEYYPPNSGTTDVYIPYSVNLNTVKKNNSDSGLTVGVYHIVNGTYLPPDNKTANNFSSHEVICVPDTITYKVDAINEYLASKTLTPTITNYYTRAKVVMQNTHGETVWMTKFQILGKPILRGDTQIVMRRLIEDTEKILSVKAQYIVTEADATALASALERYYRFGVYTYQLRSRDVFDPGNYVYIDEDYNIGINALCRITGVKDDEWKGEYTYTLEGVAAYEVETITTEGVREMPSVILPSGVETAVDKAPQIQFISASGTTTYDAPGEGDLSKIYEDGVDNYYEYTGGAWVQTTSIKIGAIIAAAFTGLISCLAIVNPEADVTSGEWLPNKDFRMFAFENNYEDQNGVDDWFAKNYLQFESTIKKFGSYSIKHNLSTDNSAILVASNTWLGTVGESQAWGCWCQFKTIPTGYGQAVIFVQADGNNYFNIQNNEGTISLIIKKGGTTTTITGHEITNDEWHYLAFSYDSVNDVGYLVIDNSIYSDTPTGSWGVGTFQGQLNVGQRISSVNVYEAYFDELLQYYDKYLDPNILVQHYNHGLPWNTDYAKDDVTLIAKTGGRVYAKNKLTIGEAESEFYNPENDISAGTLKLLSSTIELLNSSVTSTSLQTLDVSSFIPTGTKALLILCQMQEGGGAVRSVYLYAKSDESYVTGRILNYSGNIEHKQIIFPLITPYKIYWKASDTDIDLFKIDLLGYWI